MSMEIKKYVSLIQWISSSLLGHINRSCLRKPVLYRLPWQTCLLAASMAALNAN